MAHRHHRPKIYQSATQGGCRKNSESEHNRSKMNMSKKEAICEAWTDYTDLNLM